MEDGQNHTELEIAFAAVILDQFGSADIEYSMQPLRALQAARILTQLVGLPFAEMREATLKTLEGLCPGQAGEAQFLESLLFRTCS
jgi:hypothetical protein